MKRKENTPQSHDKYAYRRLFERKNDKTPQKARFFELCKLRD
ncbi:hypothetical protein yfred0001_42670 [Yersinia frederiksenii ATCC 33641]|nr:hypothetical protein yfred0001_42670 [Yersinia frederiksenii ATCC 33641]